MASVLEELVTVLGFEFEGDGLEEFNKATKQAEDNLKAIAKVGAAAAASIGIFVTAISFATDETFKFSKMIGTSFDAVQRLTFAGDIWGASMSDVTSTLQSLTTAASKAAREGSAIFGFLGISPTANGKIKDSVALLSEIADRIQGLSEARQLDLITQIGISPNMLLLMRKGSAEIKRLGTELDEIGFILTKEQAETAEAYVDAVVRAKLAVRGLANQIGVRLAPVFIEAVDTMLEWVRATKSMIDANLDVWAVNLASVLRPLAITAAVLAAALAVIALAAIGTQAAWLAVALAIGLFFDDFMAWSDGMEGTFLGKLLGSPDEFQANMDKVLKHRIFKALTDPFGDNVAGEGFANILREIQSGMFNPMGLGIRAAQSTLSTINNTFNIVSTDPAGVVNEISRKAPNAITPPHEIK